MSEEIVTQKGCDDVTGIDTMGKNNAPITEIANLRIANKQNNPCEVRSETSEKLKQSVAVEKAKSREQIKLERKTRAIEGKLRKEAKKALKQDKKSANEEKLSEKSHDREEIGDKTSGRRPYINPFTIKKDPGVPSRFRSSQPFRAVHFDIKTYDEENEEDPSNQPSVSETVAPAIHSSFLEFASRCKAKHIIGIDAVCVAFVQCFKRFLSHYVISPNQIMSRDLDQSMRHQLGSLTENGKHPFPPALGNLIRQLKKEISQLPDSISEDEGKERLCHWLDDFVHQNFELALQTISSFCQKKMRNSFFVLTFSWCPVVERIILDAYDNKLIFHVHVLDSPMHHRGKQLVKTLCSRKIHCSYAMLSAVGYLMNECDMVLLGCSAILSNGFVVADRGASQVALVASASNIPVLIAAQTCKFVDRVQSFAGGLHEVNALMCDSKEVIPADLVTALVTELRIIPPSSAPAVLKAKQLAFGL
ncbi:unnamed protein product [Thelazia callipaeda]|uniref:Translation initiation factor eIF2B subunit delta n=1 Tax=Thelazia callipaeda TaxID=103827 RepID=A0A0N5CU23_THECL|nr:unnamed protein product [Thelazia callipaeda]